MKWPFSPAQACASTMTLIIALAWTGSAQTTSENIPVPPPSLKLTKAADNLRPPNLPARPDISKSSTELLPWTAEIVKLAQAGLDEEVVLTFIDNSGTFNLDADQIIQLHHLGVANQFMTAMIHHDAEIISGCRMITASSQPTAPSSLKIILVPATNSPASAGHQNAPAQKGMNESPDPMKPETLASSDDDSASPTIPPPIWIAPKERDKYFRVRAPYPEQVTPPILVYRSAGVVPNTLLIEFSP